MTPFDLILAILCAWRLTQLLVWDDLLSPVTCWLANKHRLLDELFGCPHCMGFWCSLVSVVAVMQGHWLIRMGAWAFAVSGAVSMIQHATGWLDTEVSMPPEDPPPHWRQLAEVLAANPELIIDNQAEDDDLDLIGDNKPFGGEGE